MHILNSEGAQQRLAAVRARCAELGMNLACAVRAADFDATQPCDRRAVAHLERADTILLLGTGGAGSWDFVRRATPEWPARPNRQRNPIDEWGAAVAAQVLDELQREGVVEGRPIEGCIVRPNDAHSLNFRQLAELGGLGVISPVIGHLLHPDFGPWVSLRAALVLRGAPFGDLAASADEPRPLAGFQPCNTCSRPCARACPVGAYDDERADLLACGSHRVTGGCSSGCDALRACPVGAEHRYSEADEAWRQAHALIGIRRWLGAGAWRLVPGFLRRR